VLTIDDLPDDVLLEIFDFYVFNYQDLDFRLLEFRTIEKIESWQSLVHVCRRWRSLVFASPRRLNLQLRYCTPGRSAKKTLDVWPTLPLLILGGVDEDLESVDDVIAGLELSDRISQINLECYTTSQIEKLGRAMQVPFPELAALCLSYARWSYGPVLPDSFLGGSAPRLQYFYLGHIPFPGLPNLLLSTTHLVKLYLHRIPYSPSISPEAMATCLSTLTSLDTLHLEFGSSESYPDLKSRPPFPPTRSVLSTLVNFSFKGVNEYFEEFVARIDAPQLYRLSTTFFNDVDFDIPELNQFISCTPTLGAYDEARLIFHGFEALVRLRQTRREGSDHRKVEVIISDHWNAYRHQLSTLAKICTLLLRLLLTMENLYIDGDIYSPLIWKEGIENTEWLELLLPFTAVKNLYVSKAFSPRIAPVLQELTGGRTTQVLPALENVFLEGFQPSEPVQEGIAQFISARQLTNHPVAISVWDRDYL